MVVAVPIALALALAPAATAAGPGEIPKPPGANPGDRGWEKVTPADKGGLDVGGVSYRTYTQAAVGGGALAYGAMGVFAGAPSGAFPTLYLARRDAGGWRSTKSLSPPGSASLFGVGALGTVGRTSMVLHLDSELEHAVVETNAPIGPGAQPGAFNLYSERTDDLSLTRLAPPGPTELDSILATMLLQADSSPFFSAASSNGRNVAFNSMWPFTPNAPSSRGRRLFLSRDGEVSLVGVLPDGTVADYAYAGSDQSSHNAVSEDGTRVYFTTPVAPGSFATNGTIFLRDGDTTAQVSENDEGIFIAATPDGAKALYYELLNGRLFRYDAETGTRELLSVDDEPSDEASVNSVLAASEDLDTVYFVSQHKLTPGQPALDGRSVYGWRDGEVFYVATLADDRDDPNTGPATPSYTGYPTITTWRSRPSAAWTPDGESLVFDTTANVTGFDAGGFRQVYRYDIESDETVCLSCPEEGPATADAVLHGPPTGWLGVHARPLGARNHISRDGRRVFFNSGQALVAEDRNGRVDVYVWEDGVVHLVSSGAGAYDARFVEASGDGDDVFFATGQQLVAADTDGLVDIYDARVGGGFPEPSSNAPPCSGEECRARVDGRDLREPASNRSPEAGDATSPVSPSPGLSRPSGAQLRSLAAGRTVTLRVAVRSAGVVRVVATTRIRGRRAVVARGSARARRAGTVTVRLRLSRPARSELRRRGRLTLRLTAGAGAQPGQRLAVELQTRRKGTR